jgi:uncharacterized protein YndB with AHSA1/START domain
MKVQKSVDIAAPPETVWALLADPEKVLEWYFPWEKFEYTGDQQGGPGATLYFQERMGVQSVGLQCVVTDWVEQEAMAFEMTEGPLLRSYAERWAVESMPTGSRFSLTLEAEFSWGIVNALLGPITACWAGWARRLMPWCSGSRSTVARCAPGML